MPSDVMPTAALVLGVVSDAAEFENLASEWDRLVLAAPRPSPFLLHGWVSAWWRHFGSGATLAVVCARRDGRLVGLAPMFIKREHGLRVCRLLGAHESALGDLLVDPSDDDEIADPLMRPCPSVG